MQKLKSYIRSFRLRTLPLSLSGVLLGSMLAYADYKFSYSVVLLIVLTTISLQIVSNLANELGDFRNGTDREDRQGPQYGIQSGNITEVEVKSLLRFFVVMSLCSAISLIYVSFGSLLNLEAILLGLLAVSAVMAAIKYTLGRSPYGYRGLGDIYVFIFFGLVAVLGSYFVCSHQIANYYLVLPAISIGLLSTAVLNVNNMRDMKSDAKTRTTIALRLGLRNARIYQTLLVVFAWVSMIVFCQFRFPDPWHYLFCITLPLFVIHIITIWKKKDADLDSSLPFLVLSTFAFALLTGIGFLLFYVS